MKLDVSFIYQMSFNLKLKTDEKVIFLKSATALIR